jgi:hypothetical protein
MFHPRLTNLPPSVESTESSSETKYDINTTQNISIGRSKKLFKLRTKMSKYTPRSIQLLEGIDDFFLHVHIQIKYQISYNHALYVTWPCSLPVADVGINLSFCGNNYMITKSKIDPVNLELFIFHMYSFLTNI